jgi:hypothetical protein
VRIFIPWRSLNEKTRKRERDEKINAMGTVLVGDLYTPVEARKDKLLVHRMNASSRDAIINYLILIAFAALGLHLAILHNDDKIKALGGGFAGSVLGAVVQKWSKNDEIKPD